MRYVISSLLLLITSTCNAADWTLDENPSLAKYFESEVAHLEKKNSLRKYETLAQWDAAKPQLRTQLFDMLGLSPFPERTPLRAEITGTIETTDFRVENIHFQSSPGVYVTGNLYLPKVITGPLPTILYVCGHAAVKKDGTSYGNKTAYHHHGAWFARNGYACFTIDTLQLGEIEGIHHGTYKYDRWWWNARGYTPAGVEAWNCIRALDYLETRLEVDANRFGVTGRSGGGAYSWWISALDERIKCAVPVAGITSLRNHVVDGCVEGHCDCMYMLNTYRWDYATVAALVAPRPLLISNSDKDRIFPLDGVVDIHQQVRHIYSLYQKPRHHGLQITEGPHKDTQELRIHAFRWFNRWLKQDESLIATTATKFFEPQQLKVFSQLPHDEINTLVDETFVPRASEILGATGDKKAAVEKILADPIQWKTTLLAKLRKHCFGAWPDSGRDKRKWKADDTVRLERIETGVNGKLAVVRVHFQSQQHVPLFIDIVAPQTASRKTPKQLLAQVKRLKLLHADTSHWDAYASHILGAKQSAVGSPTDVATFIDDGTKTQGDAVAIFAGRGIGPHGWLGDRKKLIQIERRFQLIGTTSDTMRVWDFRRAMQIVRANLRNDAQISLTETGANAGTVLLASLFERPVTEIHLRPFAEPETSSCHVLNLDRIVQIPEVPIVMAALQCPVFMTKLPHTKPPSWQALIDNDRWPGHQIQTPVAPGKGIKRATHDLIRDD